MESICGTMGDFSAGFSGLDCDSVALAGRNLQPRGPAYLRIGTAASTGYLLASQQSSPWHFTPCATSALAAPARVALIVRTGVVEHLQMIETAPNQRLDAVGHGREFGGHGYSLILRLNWNGPEGNVTMAWYSTSPARSSYSSPSSKPRQFRTSRNSTV